MLKQIAYKFECKSALVSGDVLPRKNEECFFLDLLNNTLPRPRIWPFTVKWLSKLLTNLNAIQHWYLAISCLEKTKHVFFLILSKKHYPALEFGNSQCDFEQNHATRAGLNPDCRGDWAARRVLRQFAAKWTWSWEEGKGGGYLLELKKIRSESWGLHA